MCVVLSLCYVRIFRLRYVRFSIVLYAVFKRWLAASRLAARFARVSRFARLFVTLTSVRGGGYALLQGKKTKKVRLTIQSLIQLFN